jgi:hypothetical protein
MGRGMGNGKKMRNEQRAGSKEKGAMSLHEGDI